MKQKKSPEFYRRVLQVFGRNMMAIGYVFISFGIGLAIVAKWGNVWAGGIACTALIMIPFSRILWKKMFDNDDE